jgi:chromosome segregation ATPase
MVNKFKSQKNTQDQEFATKADLSEVKIELKQEMRNLGALVEQVNHNVMAIAEQYGDVKKTLDSHTEMIGNIAIDVTVLKSDVSVLKSDVSVLKSDVSILKSDVSILKSDVSVLKADVSELEIDMKEVKHNLKNNVTKQEFNILKNKFA